MVARRTRILALSAVMLTLVFIIVSSHYTATSSVSAHLTDTTTRIGAIDESAIKINEDKIKQKIQEGQIANDKSNVEIKKQQQQQVQQQREQASPKTPGQAATNEEDIMFDPAKEFQSIMSLSPVVIFSKTYCGFSRALKNLLSSEYELNPAPTIVELDKHRQGRALQDYIAQKTGRKTVPNLFINGISRGGSDEMRKLHEEGKLLDMLGSWGGKSVKVSKVNAPSNS